MRPRVYVCVCKRERKGGGKRGRKRRGCWSHLSLSVKRPISPHQQNARQPSRRRDTTQDFHTHRKCALTAAFPIQGHFRLPACAISGRVSPALCGPVSASFFLSRSSVMPIVVAAGRNFPPGIRRGGAGKQKRCKVYGHQVLQITFLKCLFHSRNCCWPVF